MIKERVDKDYSSMLRSTLTSINKVNKTDVETLKTSFGVGLFWSSHFTPNLIVSQSFSGISQATTDQLQNLPGFGHVKVNNIKAAFEKPIRHAGTATLKEVVARQTLEDKGKGKAPERAANATPVPSTSNDATSSRAPRVESPEWDIERGSLSPVEEFAIELDLN